MRALGVRFHCYHIRLAHGTGALHQHTVGAKRENAKLPAVSGHFAISSEQPPKQNPIAGTRNRYSRTISRRGHNMAQPRSIPERTDLHHVRYLAPWWHCEHSHVVDHNPAHRAQPGVLASDRLTQ
jgi:hypothetical protein